MKAPNFMVIGLQIEKLHRGMKSPPPALPDSEKPGLFRVKVWQDKGRLFVRNFPCFNVGDYIDILITAHVKRLHMN